MIQRFANSPFLQIPDIMQWSQRAAAPTNCANIWLGSRRLFSTLRFQFFFKLFSRFSWFSNGASVANIWLGSRRLFSTLRFSNFFQIFSRFSRFTNGASVANIWLGSRQLFSTVRFQICSAGWWEPPTGRELFYLLITFIVQ